MTGFRVALGGAQAHFGVKPDLTTLGKVIGGGMPVGAFGGRADIMDHIAPDGPVYQAGTLSGNPVAMAAGLKTLELISVPGFFERLEANAATLVSGMKSAASAAGVPLATNHIGGMFGLFFTDREKVSNFDDVMSCDVERFTRFFTGMLNAGIYLAPSAFETGFVSITHDTAVIDATVEAASQVFETL